MRSWPKPLGICEQLKSVCGETIFWVFFLFLLLPKQRCFHVWVKSNIISCSCLLHGLEVSYEREDFWCGFTWIQGLRKNSCQISQDSPVSVYSTSQPFSRLQSTWYFSLFPWFNQPDVDLSVLFQSENLPGKGKLQTCSGTKPAVETSRFFLAC